MLVFRSWRYDASGVLTSHAPSRCCIRPAHSWALVRQKKVIHRQHRRTHALLIPVYEGSALQQWVTAFDIFKTYNRTRGFHPRLRPPGTLHLTVGMLNLDTERLVKKACRFFECLDLDAIRRLADQEAFRQIVGYVPAEPSPQDKPFTSSPAGPPQPLTVTIENLVGAPSPEAAYHLYAVPVDPTLRLYYFMIYLRQRFIQAGFVFDDHTEEDDYSAYMLEQDQPPTERSSEDELTPATASVDVTEDCSVSPAVESSPSPSTSLKNLSEDVSRPLNPPSTKSSPPAKVSPIWKPSYIHVTVASMCSRLNGALLQNSIDVRDLVAHFQDYHLDEERTMPRREQITSNVLKSKADLFAKYLAEEEKNGEDSFEGDRHVVSVSMPGEPGDSQNSVRRTLKSFTKPNPFVWAKNIRLETLQLCPLMREFDKCDQSSPIGRARKKMHRVLLEKSLL
ncbi:uncharacterized protein BP01DRAFT_356699 [Aspergillus saccharolyticus JOP 1030-1]|uniref:Uncharacterized protein n=1 Tax=Aspergillus saccharolyticus JOP 1030-1 TaxID=1450539 RepID=A0A318ZD05_9EURO|nr:hypothetical protein BP01DRAFT_356699 [Aspergillus saccharolyticus JOP 1030-1]PYH45225.1 hypothetical protein BP01DRAFT_356699 [Aspergillus saccharolyticus JOP 1030-1]